MYAFSSRKRVSEHQHSLLFRGRAIGDRSSCFCLQPCKKHDLRAGINYKHTFEIGSMLFRFRQSLVGGGRGLGSGYGVPPSHLYKLPGLRFCDALFLCLLSKHKLGLIFLQKNNMHFYFYFLYYLHDGHCSVLCNPSHKKLSWSAVYWIMSHFNIHC